MDAKKPFFKVDTKELIDMIAKARSEQEVQKLLLDMSDSTADMQAVNSTTLGNLVEKRFGADKVTSTEDLNKYLQKIKDSDYPSLDKARKLIYPEAKDLSATYKRGYFGDGTFYSNPTMEKSVQIGDTPVGYEYSNARAKAVLTHELGHANDITALHLRRMKDAMEPKQYEELLKRIGDLGEGGEKILEHSKNIQKRYPTPVANMLTPEKVGLYRDMIMEEAPSAMREDHLRLLNKYEEALGKDLKLTPDKQLMQTHIGIDASKVPTLKGEAVNFTPDREYVKSVLEKSYSPAEAESIRSSGHHAIRTDIPNDVGHFEARNINRLAKGKGLLSAAGTALPFVGTALALSSGDVSAAAAELPSEIPVIGQAYDAIRSESAGNSQDDKDIINEIQARKNYDNSPASKDLRQKALMALTKK